MAQRETGRPGSASRAPTLVLFHGRTSLASSRSRRFREQTSPNGHVSDLIVQLCCQSLGSCLLMTAIKFHYRTDHRLSSFLSALGPSCSSEKGHGPTATVHPSTVTRMLSSGSKEPARGPGPGAAAKRGMDWMVLQKEAAIGPLEHLVPRHVPEVWTGVRDLTPVPLPMIVCPPLTPAGLVSSWPALRFGTCSRQLWGVGVGGEGCSLPLHSGLPWRPATPRQHALRSRCFVGKPCMSPRTAPRLSVTVGLRRPREMQPPHPALQPC